MRLAKVIWRCRVSTSLVGDGEFQLHRPQKTDKVETLQIPTIDLSRISVAETVSTLLASTFAEMAFP
jgi:hypothetical protein